MNSWPLTFKIRSRKLHGVVYIRRDDLLVWFRGECAQRRTEGDHERADLLEVIADHIAEAAG